MAIASRGNETYTRSNALMLLDEFMHGHLPADALRDWVDGFNWDLEETGGDALLRRAIGLLELAFHELDEGSDPVQFRQALAEVFNLLFVPREEPGSTSPL